MQLATSLRTLNLSLLFSGKLRCRKSASYVKRRVPRLACARERSSNNSDDGVKSKKVDENMIVLRMRIQEMKKKEEEDQLQDCAIESNRWTKWKREWFKNYESYVFEGVGLLQVLLMNTRPSLVLGVVAFFIFSVSTSLAVTSWYLLHCVLD